MPAAKSAVKTVSKVGKKVLTNPAVKEVLNVVKDEAVKTLVDVAASTIAGETPDLPGNIKRGRKEVSDAVRKILPLPSEDMEVEPSMPQTGNGKKRGRKRKLESEFFDIFGKPFI